MTFSAFAYLVTEDEAIGRYAVDCLLRLAAWDPDGVTTYSLNDQAHRRIAVYSALAYDWIFPLLSEEERYHAALYTLDFPDAYNAGGITAPTGDVIRVDVTEVLY